mgnify:CR=1 FL=1
MFILGCYFKASNILLLDIVNVKRHLKYNIKANRKPKLSILPSVTIFKYHVSPSMLSIRPTESCKLPPLYRLHTIPHNTLAGRDLEPLAVVEKPYQYSSSLF